MGDETLEANEGDACDDAPLSNDVRYRLPKIKFTILEEDGKFLPEIEQEPIFLTSAVVGRILVQTYPPAVFTPENGDQENGTASVNAVTSANAVVETLDSSTFPAQTIVKSPTGENPAIIEQGEDVLVYENEQLPKDKKEKLRGQNEIIGEMEIIFPTESFTYIPENVSSSGTPHLTLPTKLSPPHDNDTHIIVDGEKVDEEEFIQFFVVAFRDMLWRSLKNFTENPPDTSPEMFLEDETTLPLADNITEEVNLLEKSNDSGEVKE